uniref:Protein-tyrosine sulfotransferase n=1 Tax=Echinostoma caproni TaxID=27848 RepID=A0A183A564_9TREM
LNSVYMFHLIRLVTHNVLTRIALVTFVGFTVGILIGRTFVLTCSKKFVFIKKPQSVEDTIRPFIFIGGHESSGTGLMRIKMDAHPWIRCGAEPMISLKVLSLWRKFAVEQRDRSTEIGIYPHALNNATRSYISETIEHMGPDAKILCHKQPSTFLYLPILGKLFPKAKFIHMIRDGRGAVASSMNRHLLSKRNHLGALLKWQKQVAKIIDECKILGRHRCIEVRYESLILRTEEELRRVLAFVNAPWDPVVLHHELLKENLTGLNTSRV